MGEEIKIGVSAPGAETAASQIKALEQRIKELYKAGAAYESKGMDTAAKSARSDAALLEKDIAKFKKEGAQADKESAVAARQTGEGKLAGGGMQRGLNRALSAFGSEAGLGGITGLVGLSGPLLAVTAAAAYAGKMVSQYAERVNEVAESHERAGIAEAHRGTIDSKNAVEAERMASGNFSGNQTALDEAREKQGKFKARFGDSVKSFFGITTGAEIAERKNNLDIARLEKEVEADKAQATEKFLAGQGGKELEMLRQKTQGHLGAARALEYEVLRQKEYDRVYQATGQNADLATQAGDLAVLEQKRQTAQNIGRGISARSGAGDVAAAAHNAVEFMNGGPLIKAVTSLTAHMNQNHMAAMGHMTAPDLPRKRR